MTERYWYRRNAKRNWREWRSWKAQQVFRLPRSTISSSSTLLPRRYFIEQRCCQIVRIDDEGEQWRPGYFPRKVSTRQKVPWFYWLHELSLRALSDRRILKKRIYSVEGFTWKCWFRIRSLQSQTCRCVSKSDFRTRNTTILANCTFQQRANILKR